MMLLVFTFVIFGSVVIDGLPRTFIQEQNNNKQNNNENNETKKCGFRSWGVPMNNATLSSEFDINHFRSLPEAFPWIVKLVLTNSGQRSDQNEHLLLCTGASISKFVAVFPGKDKIQNLQHYKNTKCSLSHFVLYPIVKYKMSGSSKIFLIRKIQNIRLVILIKIGVKSTYLHNL
jgi:hypothetical protein